jgi:hypothetical protein
MDSTDRELRGSAATYPSLVAFYNADPMRLTSREQDVGLWWREGADGPLHRAAWVAETGEVYLVRLGPAAEGGGAVEVLAKIEDPERLERVLSGWRQQCGGPRSLQWLRRRTVRESPRVRRSRPRMAIGVGPTLI